MRRVGVGLYAIRPVRRRRYSISAMWCVDAGDQLGVVDKRHAVVVDDLDPPWVDPSFRATHLIGSQQVCSVLSGGQPNFSC